jgi:hypothetical protein
MVISQITGGLGNQLFQYAAGKALSLHHKVPLFLDVSSFYRKELPELEVPRNFELFNFSGISDNMIQDEKINALIKIKKETILSKRLIPAYKKKVYQEPHYHFDKNFFKAREAVLLKGGWQSEKYFKKYEIDIRNRLIINNSLIKNVLDISKIIKNQNSVSVHVRRGDYLRKKIIYEWHGVMGKDYYATAFDLLKRKTKDLKIYYFTDDIDWVTQNLLQVFDGEIVSGAITQSHYEDIFLMSQCKHNIIANSSFSWWGAWLNNNPNKIVIAPKKWFNKGPKDTQDLIPEEWLKI